MSKIMKLKGTEFDSTINNTTKPVLVVFFAPWCGYCKMQLPILDEVAQKIGDKALIAEVNIDENQDLARKFGVSGVPSTFLFKNGKQIYNQSGLLKKDDLVTLLMRNA